MENGLLHLLYVQPHPHISYYYHVRLRRAFYKLFVLLRLTQHHDAFSSAGEDCQMPTRRSTHSSHDQKNNSADDDPPAPAPTTT